MSDRAIIGWAAIAQFFGKAERTVRRWPSMGWLPCIRKNPVGGEVWALREDLEMVRAAIDAGDPMAANRLTKRTVAMALLSPEERERYDSDQAYRRFVNVILDADESHFTRPAIVREMYGDDWQAEMRAIDNGTHPLIRLTEAT